MVLRVSAALLLSILVLSACRSELKTKAKVQEAIVQRLQKSSGLDLKALDVATTDVTFKNNLAYATVAFHPKNDPSVNSGMTMKYTLEDRNDKWVVVGISDSQGHGFGSGGAAGRDRLPAGHPAIGAAPGAVSPDSVPHSQTPTGKGPGGQSQ